MCLFFLLLFYRTSAIGVQVGIEYNNYFTIFKILRKRKIIASLALVSGQIFSSGNYFSRTSSKIFSQQKQDSNKKSNIVFRVESNSHPIVLFIHFIYVCLPRRASIAPLNFYQWGSCLSLRNIYKDFIELAIFTTNGDRTRDLKILCSTP